MAIIGAHNVYDSRTPIIWVCSNGVKIQKMNNNVKNFVDGQKSENFGDGQKCQGEIWSG